MRNEVTIVQQSYQLACKDLGLEENRFFKAEESTFDWLEEVLTKEIGNLLNTDFNRLLNALYRIDIPESLVEKILTEAVPEEIANQLAKAVINREKQKVITRLKYSS